MSDFFQIICRACGKDGASFLHPECVESVELAALRARVARLEEAMHKLLVDCEVSDSACYCTLSTSHVSEIINAALRSEG